MLIESLLGGSEKGNSLFGIGKGAYGQLANGITAIELQKINDSSWASIAESNKIFNMAAIRSDGLFFSWGYKIAPSFLNPAITPTQYGSQSWTTASYGYYMVAAIRNDGLLFTWGFGDSGQLGNGSILDVSSPVQIGSNSWSSVSCGYFFTAAIRNDGLLFAWGHGGHGQLGNGSTSNHSSPVQVGSNSWSAVIS